MLFFFVNLRGVAVNLEHVVICVFTCKHCVEKKRNSHD